MSDLAFMVLIIAAGLAALGGATAGLAILTIAVDERIRRWRRDRQGLTEREVASQLDPGEYGVDISVWPSRAPRNGSSYEDITG